MQKSPHAAGSWIGKWLTYFAGADVGAGAAAG